MKRNEIIVLSVITIIFVIFILGIFFFRKKERYQDLTLEDLLTLPEDIQFEIISNFSLERLNEFSRMNEQSNILVNQFMIWRYNIPLNYFNNSIYLKYTEKKLDANIIRRGQSNPEMFGNYAEDHLREVQDVNEIFYTAFTYFFRVLRIIGVNVNMIELKPSSSFPDESEESRRLMMINFTNFPVTDESIMNFQAGQNFRVSFKHEYNSTYLQINITRGTNPELVEELNTIFRECKERIQELNQRRYMDAHLLHLSHAYIEPGVWGLANELNDNTQADFYSFNLNSRIRYYDANKGYDTFSSRFP